MYNLHYTTRDVKDKTEFCSHDVVETAFNLAVRFNLGRGSLKDVFERFHIRCGHTTESFLSCSDDVHVWYAEHHEKNLVKNRRQQMRFDRVTLKEEQLTEGRVQYESGEF